LWDALREQQVIAEKKDSNVRVIAVLCRVSGEMRCKWVCIEGMCAVLHDADWCTD
jgi:hypothetical protein